MLLKAHSITGPPLVLVLEVMWFTSLLVFISQTHHILSHIMLLQYKMNIFLGFSKSLKRVKKIKIKIQQMLYCNDLFLFPVFFFSHF